MTNPFIKVEWEDSVENFTPERIKRVKEYFQTKYNAKSIQIVTKTLSNKDYTKLRTLEVTDNILDHQYQKKLMKDYISENKIDVNWDMLERLDKKVNDQIDKSRLNNVRYNKWFIKKIEFSNFLSFGLDNKIDFKEINGITVIESTPKNFGGKTTATVDLLMFLFFNSTTKTKTNSELFNKFSDSDEVVVKGYLNIDDEDFVISRTLTRKKSKIGEFNVKSELDFYKQNPDGSIQNLTGEQRRETETFIASAIGTEEDFLSTILTTGNNLEELIESKPTARGQILTKFLGLENLKQKEEICKEIHNDWKNKLISNTYNIVTLENENNSSILNIQTLTTNNETLSKDLEKYNNELKVLELNRDKLLISRNNDIDNEVIKTNPVLLQREISDLNDKKRQSKIQLDSIIVVEPSKFYLEEEHENIKNEVNKLIVDGKMKVNEKQNIEKLIHQLETGSICPTCNRLLEDVDHTNEIEKLKNDIIELDKLADEIRKQYKLIESKEKELSSLKKEYDEYERNKLRKEKHTLEISQRDHQITLLQNKIDNYEKNKSKLDQNQKIDAQIVAVKTQIETANANIRVSINTIEKNKLTIESLKEKISSNITLIEKIKAEDQLNIIFKIYLTIYGKNGIPKTILKNMIPLLNIELQRLLTDSTHFTLELNISDKNELEFLMIDNESRVVKPLNSGSGYEKTISSLALRSVLTKISSLPKPNVVVMDEVFGKIADENLDMVGEFFKKIKNYFEHIFVISHNPLIRNWSDNLIMIKKEENISKIDFINTKIS